MYLKKAAISLFILLEINMEGLDNVANEVIKDDLQYLVDSGMIDKSQVHDLVEKMKNKELLDMHPYKIWQNKSDGKWYTYFPDAQKGRVLKKRKNKEDLEKVIIEFWKNETKNPTIREAFEEWNDRRLKLNKISEATHMRNQQLFERHYKEMGQKHIKNLTESELQDFLEEQIFAYNLTAKAFANLKSITKGFLLRAKRQGLISFSVDGALSELDITDKEFYRPEKDEKDDVFTEEEFTAFVKYILAHQDIHNLGIMMMLATGIRVGELVALKFKDFEENTVFRVRRTETRYADENGKNHVEIKDYTKTPAGNRRVVMSDNFGWILDAIRTLNPDGDYLFMRNGKRLTTNAIRKRQYRVCVWAGLQKEKSPHKCRKTFATMLLDNGLDCNMIITQMGQTDIATTENYYHRDRKDISRKKEIMNSIPELSTI